MPRQRKGNAGLVNYSLYGLLNIVFSDVFGSDIRISAMRDDLISSSKINLNLNKFLGENHFQFVEKIKWNFLRQPLWAIRAVVFIAYHLIQFCLLFLPRFIDLASERYIIPRDPWFRVLQIPFQAAFLFLESGINTTQSASRARKLGLGWQMVSLLSTIVFWSLATAGFGTLGVALGIAGAAALPTLSWTTGITLHSSAAATMSLAAIPVVMATGVNVMNQRLIGADKPTLWQKFCNLFVSEAQNESSCVSSIGSVASSLFRSENGENSSGRSSCSDVSIDEINESKSDTVNASVLNGLRNQGSFSTSSRERSKSLSELGALNSQVASSDGQPVTRTRSMSS